MQSQGGSIVLLSSAAARKCMSEEVREGVLDAKTKGAGKIGWKSEKLLIDRKGLAVACFGCCARPDGRDLGEVTERELVRSVAMEEEQRQ